MPDAGAETSSFKHTLFKALNLTMRIVVVQFTLLFLASIGGGMAFAAPGLVPLHWWLAWTSTWGRFGWVFLAFLSTTEAFAIYAYTFTGAFSWTIGLGAGLGIAALFVATLGLRRERN